MNNEQPARLVERLPEVPPLSPEQVEEITRIVFVESDPRPANFILVMGTRQLDWEGVAQLIKSGIAPLAVLCGWGPPEEERSVPLAKEMRSSLIQAGIVPERLLTQGHSTNTLEDVLFAKELLEERGLPMESLIIAVKAHHAGRSIRTARKYFPEADLSVFSSPAAYEGIEVRADNWPEHDIARCRVYGEYLRILKYAERGDIAPL